VTFVSSAVLATVIALGSSLPFAIGGPESSTAAVTAILASSLVERMALADTTAPQLAPVLITLGLSTIVTGIGHARERQLFRKRCLLRSLVKHSSIVRYCKDRKTRAA
jgi:hypothetical protein